MDSYLKTPCYFGVNNEDGVYQASYEITNMCNLECSHCFNRSTNDSNKGLEKNEIFDLIDELSQNNVKSIYITGGEPTVYPNFSEVLDYLKSKNIEIILASNAYNITQHIDIIKKYISPNVGVFVSIDGLSKTHNEFRNKPGAFENAIESIKLLINNNIPVRISTVLWKKNLNEIEELIKFVKSLGVYQIHFTVLVKSGRATESDNEIDGDNYKKINDMVEALKEKYNSNSFTITSRRNTTLDDTCQNCKAGEKIIHIDANGVISPCSWIAKSELKDKYSLKWEKGNLKQCINKIQTIQDLVEVRRKKDGNSGCPAIASMSGDMYSKDPLNELLSK